VNEQTGEYEFLWKLLANPADNNPSYIAELKSLVAQYQQSGVLWALMLPNGEKENLKHAAAYFDPATIYKLAMAVDSLPTVTEEQVVYCDGPIAAGTYFTAPDATTDGIAIEDDTPAEDHTENMPEYHTFSEQETIADAYTPPTNDPETAHNTFAEQEKQTDDYPQHAREYDEYMAKTDTTVQITFDNNVEYFHQDIDDEIYDEIVSIEDIGLEQSGVPDKTSANEEKNGAVNDTHFVFQPSGHENNQLSLTAGENTEPQNEAATNEVSKYNDEKMPYSFMWWLDKTRKEHADVYQPYINNPKPAAQPEKRQVADELQQQYYENIVSISSIDEIDQAPPKAAGKHPHRKEDKIIERFIQHEPQIKHPGNIKLDNENKAKKSSEDGDELVTETLARVYTDQMLYNKAILTYKKLMLKFPEKSLYFAGQIEQLENKIN